MSWHKKMDFWGRHLATFYACQIGVLNPNQILKSAYLANSTFLLIKTENSKSTILKVFVANMDFKRIVYYMCLCIGNPTY